MRPVSFPCSFISGPLCSLDYQVYHEQFRQEWLKQVPTAQTIRFHSLNGLSTHLRGVGESDTSGVIDELKLTGKPAKAGPSTLLFPLVLQDKTLVAVLSGIDPLVVERASSQWLAEVGSVAADNCLRIKADGNDPLSHLYNGQTFHQLLTSSKYDSDLHIVLVELLPRARVPRESFEHVRHVAHDLSELNRFRFPLFHLGQSVFAFMITDRERSFLKSFCMSVITFLKMKKVHRIHCGYSSASLERSSGRLHDDGLRIILDEAWHALHAACKRGPFAFCDYDFLANPRHFPLVPLSRNSMARLQNRWKNCERFSLICFKPDFEEREKLDEKVLRHFRQSNLVVDDRYYFVIKPNSSPKQTEQWATKNVRQLKERHGENFSLSAGVSNYPFRAYPKVQIGRNCQKALLHGSFFGPGSVVVFDSLSLNVSGDAYFGEGDLSTAIREYRDGLVLAPEDINLLNSLGVAYALMNRTKDALNTFNQALGHSPANFMALYNKGLSEQALGRYRAAIRSLLQAREACDSSTMEEAGSMNELEYHLGVAFYQGGYYQKCISQLELWYQEQPDKRIAGKSCRYIGLSYYRARNNSEASTWLQRSLSYDEFDAEALSLLGELYLTEKQGDEIALRLCEKGVELDSNDSQAMLRYGKALAACGDEATAVECLKRCVVSKQTRHEAWYELALIYLGWGEHEETKRYAKKLVRAKNTPTRLRKKAQSVLVKTRKKRT